MTDQPRDGAHSDPPATPEAPRTRHTPDQPALPRWIPAVIGSVLVLIAALAVFTGIRYRNPTLAEGIIRSRKAPRAMTHGGPPGEPGPGASLVFPGESGDNAPVARQPGPGRARAQITGNAAGISAMVHLFARRGLVTNVVPDDAMIYLNDLAIGEARQFNTVDEIYDFPAPGSYSVRVVAPGYREQQFVVIASETAAAEIARIDVKLVRAQ